ncbi:hypothetical protein BDV98DRAFT_336433 [Pterulicium gracile]|uniref:Uncharacterized protein n=1 Tax=Pterulicium gracile TaxID=1884261 RepID=A0A5C3Q5D6_9AGAR|nr:hypothetical protein BDV98DRAFT_336433 [Pterula gracilis]
MKEREMRERERQAIALEGPGASGRPVHTHAGTPRTGSPTGYPPRERGVHPHPGPSCHGRLTCSHGPPHGHSRPSSSHDPALQHEHPSLKHPLTFPAPHAHPQTRSCLPSTLSSSANLAFSRTRTFASSGLAIASWGPVPCIRPTFPPTFPRYDEAGDFEPVRKEGGRRGE